jgi:hypothetical protein
VSFKISVSGDRRPFRVFSWRSASSQWAHAVGPVVRDALKRDAPVAPVNGGRLRESIDYEPRVGSSSAQLVFASASPYAGFVIGGTSPHIIRARRAKALRFQQGGQTRFARQVHHPGTRANPFPERAIRPLLPLIQHRFREIVQSSLKG